MILLIWTATVTRIVTSDIFADTFSPSLGLLLFELIEHLVSRFRHEITLDYLKLISVYFLIGNSHLFSIHRFDSVQLLNLHLLLLFNQHLLILFLKALLLLLGLLLSFGSLELRNAFESAFARLDLGV